MATALETYKQWWDIYASGDLSGHDQIIDDDAECIIPGFELKGRANIQPMIAGYQQAFPDLVPEIVRVHETNGGAAVVVEARLAGHHLGTMITPMGEVPATGNELVLRATECVDVRDGKIVSWRAYHDMVPMLVSLGLMPDPTASASVA